MTWSSRLEWWVLCALSACSPVVPVGNEIVLNEDLACEEVTVASTACPATPWGALVSFATVGSLERRLVGRWAFCGGEKRYTGRGVLKGFPHGLGVEFWSDAGQLRFAFLQGQAPNPVRTQDAQSSGTVHLVLDNGRGRALLRADGNEVVWNIDFFEGQAVLQNGAFDLWNFVALE